MGSVLLNLVGCVLWAKFGIDCIAKDSPVGGWVACFMVSAFCGYVAVGGIFDK